ncbi:MAG TPA: hypothetical protein VGH67_09700 [Solirubrobacteraceae bacterium]|jgi:hypothetical protein
MQFSGRARAAATALLTSGAIAGVGVVAQGSAAAHPGHAAAAAPSVKRFSLAGYVLNAAYTRGRNAGNTFQQTYKAGTVHGVPIKGPFVGQKFPVEDYVAMPIGNHELYVAWLDTKSHALLDVFVMNFKTHAIYDYAPGSLHPESTGTVTVVKSGSSKAP